ncbi:N-acetyltransferase family protein [Serratia sp. NPDC078593]|uniref:GNAT family N-acetyltransferase n=1 Tax=unclassified Serratia (in: enterobacteria) TaxID=2647522 RepID=UPI0037CD614E
MLIRQATSHDYPAILALQAKNTPENLNAQQRQQGFIVSEMNEAQVAKLNDELGILIAEQDGRLAGFVCLARPNMQPRPPVVDAMLSELANHYFADTLITKQRLFLYGPVCLASDWRGKGVLKRLFNAVKTRTRDQFDIGILFINQSNPHSLAAHVKGLGMTILGEFSSQGEHYQLLAFTPRI